MYPSGKSRNDSFERTATTTKRSTKWTATDGYVEARATWNNGSGEVKWTDRSGRVVRTARTDGELAKRTLTTSVFGADGNLVQTTRVQFFSDTGYVTNTQRALDGGEDWKTTTYTTATGATVTVTGRSEPGGIAHGTETVTSGAYSSSTDMVQKFDGSQFSGSVTQTASGPGANDTTVTQTGHADLNADGSTTGFQGTEVTDNKTGASQFDSVGVNSAGEPFYTTGGKDAQGNQTMTTTTEHKDGTISETTITKTAGGDISISTQEYDKDGNPIQPETPGSGVDQNNNGKDSGGQGTEGGGPKGGEGTGGDDGKSDGQGADPSDDGTDAGPPPVNLGRAPSSLGSGFGSPFTVLTGTQGTGGGRGDDDNERRGSNLIGALTADVDDGGDGVGAPHTLKPHLVSDSARRAFSTVPVDGWEELRKPEVLLSMVSAIAGKQAATVVQDALVSLQQ
ncbi:hypothetical protein [Paraburkholderia sp. EG304]|uniref:hypothetical protein n=1 Tax=Paraburkholderia sp. EG304 TaxID=3237015 RepID=UPI00397B61DA